MNDTSPLKISTPLTDSLIRRQYGLPHDFDIDSFSPHELENIGHQLHKEAVALKASVEAERAKQPPTIIPQFLKTAAYKTGARQIAGIAATGTISSHGLSMHPGGCRITLPIPMLVNHDIHKCVGSIEAAEITADGKVFIWANLDQRCDAKTWERIRMGELGSFSIDWDRTPGSYSPPIEIHGIKHYYKWRLKEVSLCETGRNHECIVTEVWPVEFNKAPGTSVQIKNDDVSALAERIASLEGRPTMQYRGVWNADDSYDSGDFVTDKGSMWACQAPTKSRPGTDDTWKLAVKKGAVQ